MISWYSLDFSDLFRMLAICNIACANDKSCYVGDKKAIEILSDHTPVHYVYAEGEI